ncbi:transposase-like zinc-binding domain-containing protein [Erwinia pyrifoliae]|nr:IS1-like element transposase [Erwinia pyrifoliae]MCU8588990.1 IS1-like element transposase [Erwinia pyrifoliae]UWS29332.1 IS1-like element transposase [Erwinia pyrifoliae]CAX57457.1 Putative insertion element protein [Erwinia pyrifoliae Ep1/96]
MKMGDIACPRCSESARIRRNGRSASGIQRYRCQGCLKTFQLHFYYAGSSPNMQKTIIEMMNDGSEQRDIARKLGVSLETVLRHLKDLRLNKP